MSAVLDTHDRWRVVPQEIKGNETLISIEDNEVVYGNKKEEAEQEEDITLCLQNDPFSEDYCECCINCGCSEDCEVHKKCECCKEFIENLECKCAKDCLCANHSKHN